MFYTVSFTRKWMIKFVIFLYRNCHKPKMFGYHIFDETLINLRRSLFSNAADDPFRSNMNSL